MRALSILCLEGTAGLIRLINLAVPSSVVVVDVAGVRCANSMLARSCFSGAGHGGDGRGVGRARPRLVGQHILPAGSDGVQPLDLVHRSEHRRRPVLSKPLGARSGPESGQTPKTWTP